MSCFGYKRKIHVIFSCIIFTAILCIGVVAAEPVHAANQQVVVRGGAAYDEVGNRLVLKGKVLGLGPAQGVYNDLIISTSWSSSNEKVMRITEGKNKPSCIVKAVGTGTCVVDGVTESELLYPVYDYQIMHNEHKFRVVEKIKSLSVPVKATVYIGTPEKIGYKTSPSSVYSQYMSGMRMTSSNKKIATVNNQGKVIGVAPGKVTITIKTDNGFAKKCKVTIKRPALKSLKINHNKLTLEQGKKKQLKVNCVPKGSYAKVTWNSSNKRVAVVNKNGYVTAKKAGSTVITAKTASGKKVSCKVTVPKKPTAIKLNKTSLSLAIGKTYALSYFFAPKDSLSAVTWSSSNKNVATVSNKGKITARRAGTAVITAKTTNGKKASCKVTVLKPVATDVSIAETQGYLKAGNTMQLKAVLEPANAGTVVKWTSDNTGVAKVDTTGKVTAISPGTVTITATAGKVKDSIQIMITESVWADISNGTIEIYDSKAVQAGKIITFGADKTLTLVQSYGASDIIFYNTSEIRVVFTGITMRNSNVFFYGDENTAKVVMESVKGTSNVFSTNTYCFKGTGYDTLILQGDGYMYFSAKKGSSFNGKNLIIKSGDVSFNINYGERDAAIQCNYLEIHAGSCVEVWADSGLYSCVMTPRIAQGTLYYQGNLYK